MSERFSGNIAEGLFFRRLWGRLGCGMTFDTLLRAAITITQVKHYIKRYSIKSRTLLSKNEVRDKVRDNALTSVYCWSSLVLRPPILTLTPPQCVPECVPVRFPPPTTSLLLNYYLPDLSPFRQ
jgi:hypothetical protein